MRVEHTFAGMGTEIVLRGSEPGVAAARRRFDEVEQIASRFRPDSDLSRLNRDPRRAVPVGSDLAALIEAAGRMRDRTGGLVDPAVGGAVMAWGYDRDFPAVRGIDVDPEAEPVHPWSIFDRVVERDPAVALDLGGVAKGWTADRVVEAGLVDFASAGGDLRSVEPTLEVEILDPWGEVAATVPVGVGALATSSVTRRQWRVAGAQAHHLIDPRSGRPADTPILSASVVADTAIEAEAGAKAVLLHGVDGLAWADRQPWIRQAVVIWHGGSVYATEAAA